MYDLMYCEESEIYEEVKNLIKKNYPEARIEDASDGIHRYRFSINTDSEDDKDEWLNFVRNVL